MEALPELKTLRNKYLKFLLIFDSENIIEAEKKYLLFIRDPIVNEKLPVLVKQLKKHFDNKELFSYMFFYKSLCTKIRTTNQTRTGK